MHVRKINIINKDIINKMLDAARFLVGFNLSEGEIIDNYQLTTIKIKETPIKRYEEYRYDIIIILIDLGHGSYDILMDNLINKFSRVERIYGTDKVYQCRIDKFAYGDIISNERGNFQINVTGHAIRID